MCRGASTPVCGAWPSSSFVDDNGIDVENSDKRGGDTLYGNVKVETCIGVNGGSEDDSGGKSDLDDADSRKRHRICVAATRHFGARVASIPCEYAAAFWSRLYAIMSCVRVTSDGERPLERKGERSMRNSYDISKFR